MFRLMARDLSLLVEVQYTLLHQIPMLYAHAKVYRWFRTHLVNGGDLQCRRPFLYTTQTAGFHELPCWHHTYRALLWKRALSCIWRGRQDGLRLQARIKSTLTPDSLWYALIE